MNNYIKNLIIILGKKSLLTLAKIKYGKNTDICFVWREKESILFETEYLNDTGRNLKEIRNKIGQNILLQRGPIELIKNPTIICLFINKSFFPNKLDLVQINNCIKDIKSWKGQSCINDKIGLVYKYF